MSPWRSFQPVHTCAIQAQPPLRQPDCPFISKFKRPFFQSCPCGAKVHGGSATGWIEGAPTISKCGRRSAVRQLLEFFVSLRHQHSRGQGLRPRRSADFAAAKGAHPPASPIPLHNQLLERDAGQVTARLRTSCGRSPGPNRGLSLQVCRPLPKGCPGAVVHGEVHTAETRSAATLLYWTAPAKPSSDALLQSSVKHS
jgi:hypothetical protein